MSQYGQVTKSLTFQDFVRLVFWLHTARTENPDNPQTHPNTSDINEYHSRCPQTPPRHPPDTPKASPRNITCQQTPTDANRHCQTPKITDRCCLSMSGGVCWHLLLSVGMLCSLELSGGCLGDVWVVSGGVLSGFHGNWRRSDAFWVYLGSGSLQYGAKILIWQSHERCDVLSLDHTETLKYQNLPM